MDEQERLDGLERSVEDLERVVAALVDLVAARHAHDDAVQQLIRAHRKLFGQRERGQRRR